MHLLQHRASPQCGIPTGSQEGLISTRCDLVNPSAQGGTSEATSKSPILSEALALAHEPDVQ